MGRAQAVKLKRHQWQGLSCCAWGTRSIGQGKPLWLILCMFSILPTPRYRFGLAIIYSSSSFNYNFKAVACLALVFMSSPSLLESSLEEPPVQLHSLSSVKDLTCVFQKRSRQSVSWSPPFQAMFDQEKSTTTKPRASVDAAAHREPQPPHPAALVAWLPPTSFSPLAITCNQQKLFCISRRVYLLETHGNVPFCPAYPSWMPPYSF